MRIGRNRIGLVVFLVGGLALAMAGCKEEGSAEKAGKELDKAAEDAGEAVEDAGKKLDEALGGD